MFDVGFSELLVIALVALIVIGPERLPKVARTAGHLLGRLQRYVNDVKAEINREMQVDELRKLQQQVEQSAREVETGINKELHAVEDSLNKAISPPAEPDSVSPAAGAKAGNAQVPLAAASQAQAQPAGQRVGASEAQR
jgi:sec-independent protein translocase protein TatB